MISGGRRGPHRKKRYTSGLVDEEAYAQIRPHGEATESRTHMMGGRRIYKEERGLSESDGGLDKCDMKRFNTSNSSEKTIALLE